MSVETCTACLGDSVAALTVKIGKSSGEPIIEFWLCSECADKAIEKGTTPRGDHAAAVTLHFRILELLREA